MILASGNAIAAAYLSTIQRKGHSNSSFLPEPTQFWEQHHGRVSLVFFGVGCSICLGGAQSMLNFFNHPFGPLSSMFVFEDAQTYYLNL